MFNPTNPNINIPQICGYCGMIHHGMCPKIKKIEYYENGTIKNVELHPYVVSTFKCPHCRCQAGCCCCCEGHCGCKENNIQIDERARCFNEL